MADRQIDPETRRVLARLRPLLAAGASFRACERKLKRPHVTLYRWAQRYQLPHRTAGLSREKDRKIRRLLDREERPRAIMRQVGCSFDAVQRRRDQATVDRFRSLSGSTPLPTSKWRCPKCGGLSVTDPCRVDGTPRPRARPRIVRPTLYHGTAERPEVRA